MGFIFRILFIGLACLLAGCRQVAVPPESTKSAMQDMAKIDVQLNHYPSYAEYDASVYKELESIVQKVSSASELKTLFMECHQRWKASPEVPQDRIQWLDPYCEARSVIIHRLAELNTEEAAKVLVELYADETIGWDGGFSLEVCHAITRCGRHALPHLTKLNFGERKEKVQILISCIEKGQLYGP